MDLMQQRRYTEAQSFQENHTWMSILARRNRNVQSTCRRASLLLLDAALLAAFPVAIRPEASAHRTKRPWLSDLGAAIVIMLGHSDSWNLQRRTAVADNS